MMSGTTSRHDIRQLQFSCLIDRSLVIQLQAAQLICSMLELAHIRPQSIIVHGASDPLPDFLAWLTSHSIDFVRVRPFGHPYCNKLQQLDTFLYGASSHVVFLDCDTLLAHNVPWPLPQYLAAKKVDGPFPPAPVVQGIYRAAGLRPEWVRPDVLSGETPARNFNGGVYIAQTAFLKRLSPIWRKWARWCLARTALFSRYVSNIDQVALALALTEMNADVELLHRAYNFPAYAGLPLSVDCSPHILHYHRHVDLYLRPLPVGLPLVDAEISRLNQHLSLWQRTMLPRSLTDGARHEFCLRPQL